ncbi:MAG: hypothetical protein ACI9J3_002641, partial [Parvicellaceae bacterium]
MKNAIKRYHIITVLLMFPLLTFGQINLGTVSNFALFTSSGAVSNTGVSNVTGDVGSDLGAVSGFGIPSILVGTEYTADAVTAQAKIDLATVYTQLTTEPVTNSSHTPAFGSGETLNAGVYTIAGAGSLAGVLTLDGLGDTNAVFIFRFGGAFAVGAASSVVLTNDARYCNIYWVAEGALSVGANSIMKGTLLANNAAVSAANGSNIEGRLLSTTGAIAFGPATIGIPVCTSVPPPPPPVPDPCCSFGYGSAIDFVLFTSNGALSNSGTSTFTGDIGSDLGSISGFGAPTIVNGTIYNTDAVTAQAKVDLATAYTQLMAVPCTGCNTHAPAFGSGETLTTGVYTIAGAGSLAGVLTLDGLGDTNAVFIFRFGGAFATGALSSVVLINGARYCNVYWVAEGAVSMGASTIMKGTMITNNAAVSAGASCDIVGRMLSTAGAVSFGPGTITHSNCPFICDTTLVANITPDPAIICPGDTGITLTVNTTGGVPPFSYQWNTSDTSQSIFVGAGTYTVVISNITGCPPVAASVLVTQIPGTISANAGPDQTVCTNATIVSLSGGVTGSTGGMWSGGAGVYNQSDQDTVVDYYPTAAEIDSGSVTLTLINTGTGTCPADSDEVTITFVDFDGVNTVVPNNISCFGSNDGSASISSVGGTPVYTYSWNTTPIQTGSSAINIPPGTYTIDVADGLGCPTTETVTITEPAILTSTFTQSNVSCFFGSDGTAIVTPFGGTGPYSYSWSPSGGTDSTATGLGQGTYTATITDANGCQDSTVITITQPTFLSSTITGFQNVNCFGGNDGTATVTMSGGTPGYTFLWAPTGGNSQTGTGLFAGSYTITVSDSNGCQALANVIITEPLAPLSLTYTMDSVVCFGESNGTATVTVAGGTAPYTYSWIGSTSTTDVAPSLIAGVYTVTVTDSNNCVITQSITVLEPPLLSLSPSYSSSTCGLSNGQINANPSGGVTPYTLLWSSGETTNTVTNVGAGTYIVTVTDLNGCSAIDSIVVVNATVPLDISISLQTNVSCFGGNDGTATVSMITGTIPLSYSWTPTGGGGQTGLGLSNGQYIVSVIDGNGCTDADTVLITQPLAPLTMTTATFDVLCNGGTSGFASASASGGTSPYSYSWTNGDLDSLANNVGVANYVVTITDLNGCSIDSTLTVNQPSLLQVSMSQTNTSCNGSSDGEGVGTPTGGTLPYTYLWTNADADSIANGITAGSYGLTVTDGNGCTITDSVTITEPQSLNVSFTQTNVSCNAGSDGEG